MLYFMHMEDRRPRIARNIIVIAFVALASGLGQDLIVPVLPAYLTLIGVGSAGIGLVDGLLQGVTDVFRFVSGVLSDRFRRRKGLILGGYAVSSIARPLLALAGSFGAVAALRVVDGVGKGVKDAPRDALIADSAEHGQGRAFGFQRFVDTAGSVIGPLIATTVLVLLSASVSTYRLIFLLAALPGAAAVGLILFGIKEPPRTGPSTGAGKRPLPTTFWLFAFAVTFAMFTKINDSLFLLRAADLGIPRAWIPAVFAGFTLIYALLAYPVGIWSDRAGKPPFIAVGWFVLAVVQLGFSFRTGLFTTLALFAFYGVFFALTEGSGRAFIAELVPLEARGSAYAVYYTMIGIAVIAGGFGLGHIWQASSPAVAFRIAAAGSLLSCLLFAAFVVLRRRGRRTA